jgi:hypothetical protein
MAKPEPMACAVCLYNTPAHGVARDAMTIIEGYAVCWDHVELLAQGTRFADLMKVARANG